MGSKVIVGSDAKECARSGASKRTREIRLDEQAAEQQQIHQVAEAIVIRARHEALGAGVQLLGDLVAGRDHGHRLWLGHTEQ
jgi:hypothetical protein